MKSLQKIMITILVLSLVISCQKEKPIKPSGSLSKGYYILNSGKWKGNNSNLSFYSTETKTLTENVFETVNGKKLGDTGNDMIVYGSKIYITVTESAMLFVTDLKGKIVKEITMQDGGKNLSPRNLCGEKGKVYVTYRDGFLGEIDTVNFATKKVKVGSEPEGVLYLSGKIYVANSDGTNSGANGSVSVVNAESFSVTKTIEKVINPQTFHLFPNGALYLITWSNYPPTVPATLYKVDTKADALVAIKDIVPTRMAVGKSGKGFLISSVYDEKGNQTVKYYFFNSATDKLEGEFATTKEIVKGEYICSDVKSGDIFIGATDYVNNGDVYVLNEQGKVQSKIPSGGINPIKVCSVGY